MTDRRQFFLSDRKCDFKRTDWFVVSLDRCYLYYQKDLTLVSVKDKCGKLWFLLGLAFCSDEQNKNATADIENAKTEDIKEISLNWAGRFAVLNSEELFTDAASLMGVFYYSDSKNWIISSSLNIISLLTDTTAEYKTAIHNFCKSFPAPYTPLKNVMRLLASQSLDYADGLKIKFHNKIKPYNYNSENITKEIGNRLSNILANINAFSGKKMELALTCGYDSRLLLAAILKNRLPFEAFTFEHNTISVNDHKIPEKLSRDFGFEYKYYKRNKKPFEERYAVYDEHCFKSIQETDREFFAYGLYDNFNKNHIIVKGGILDLLRSSKLKKYRKSEELFEFIRNSYKNKNYSLIFDNTFNEWFSWIKNNNINIDLGDRFNIEEHIATWESNLMQSLDILDTETVQAANCGAIISLILSYKDTERENKETYNSLYKYLYPEVMKYPINPKENLRLVRYYWNKLKNIKR